MKPSLAEFASLAAMFRTDISLLTKLIDFTFVAELTLVTALIPVMESTFLNPT